MATSVIVIILILILSYVVGSIPMSYLVGRIFYGVDIRNQGSGNVGGANAIRLFGKKLGLFSGAFDIFKGYLMVIIMQSLSSDVNTSSTFFGNQDALMALAGFLAVIGHCYSFLLSFAGGKGGATTAGVVFAIDPLTGLILITFWIIVVGTTRFTSLGNLLGIFIVPVFMSYRTSSEFATMGWLLVVLIWWRHRANVSRLMKGDERKLGQKEVIKTEE